MSEKSINSTTNDDISPERENNTLNRRSILKAVGFSGLAAATPGVAGASTDSSSTKFDPVEATVADIIAAITTEQATARSIAKTYIERAKSYEDELNAFITFNSAALDRADELDAKYDKSGLVGPLHGVPLVIKDNYDTGDLPTTAGSVLFKGSVPSDDAYTVEQLRDAGGVIIGKTNLDEFASGGQAVSSLGGQTYNPYDLSRIPRGSSGGTAAAIAASLGVIGMGSDTASSIRGPSTVNNMVGIRPTIGTVSRDGIVPISLTQDTGGPMTRTVTDAAIAMDVLSGYDPADPVTARSIGNIPAATGDSYTDYLNPDGLEGARIGVLREFYDVAPGFSEPVESDPEVIDVIDAALEDMKSLGATIIDPVEIPGLFEAVQQVNLISYEFKRDLNNYLENRDDAPVSSFTEVFESDTLHPSVRGLFEGAAETDPETLDENTDYLSRLARRDKIQDMLFEAMAAEDLDAIAYPSENLPPAPLSNPDKNGGGNTFISAGSGFPAITVPAGFTSTEDLPAGIELLSRPFTEEQLIEFAYSYEQGTMHRRSPTGFGSLEN